jgi:adenosylcobinamide-GDP ribazoletransferase
MSAPLADDLRACLRSYSRLPLPAPQGREPPDFRTAVRALPLAGALIGLCAAAALLCARALGLPPMLAAALAVGALVLVTGALHETRLAELADGLGAASHDERLGAPGVIALVMSLLLRSEALACIAERSAVEAAAAVIFAAALSRTAGLLPIAILAPARGEGEAAMRPFEAALRTAGLLAAALALPPLAAGAPLVRVLLAGAGAAGAAYAIAWFARRRGAGLGGDVLGAAQQAAEIAALLALASR